VAAFPESEAGRDVLAIALRNAGDQAGAIEVFRQNLTTHPKSAWTFMNLAQALADRGELEEAMLHAARAIELSPEEPALRVRTGLILIKAGKSARAVEQYREAARLGPQDAEVFAQLANALHAEKDLEGAKEAALRSVELNPRRAGAHSNLASALWSLGETEAAVKAARIATYLDPQLDAAHTNLCLFLRGLRDGEALRLELERWAWARPRDPRALEELARHLLERGSPRTPADLESAFDLSSRARELTGGRDAMVLRTLAEAQFSRGDPASAVASAEAALALSPDDRTRDFLERRIRKYREAAASRPETRPREERE
jgi:tetratricopeptide (TPR) repeat protein